MFGLTSRRAFRCTAAAYVTSPRTRLHSTACRDLLIRHARWCGRRPYYRSGPLFFHDRGTIPLLAHNVRRTRARAPCFSRQTIDAVVFLATCLFLPEHVGAPLGKRAPEIVGTSLQSNRSPKHTRRGPGGRSRVGNTRAGWPPLIDPCIPRINPPSLLEQLHQRRSVVRSGRRVSSNMIHTHH